MLSKRRNQRKHHVAEREENAVGDNRSQADSVAHKVHPRAQELIKLSGGALLVACSCLVCVQILIGRLKI